MPTCPGVATDSSAVLAAVAGDALAWSRRCRCGRGGRLRRRGWHCPRRGGRCGGRDGGLRCRQRRHRRLSRRCGRCSSGGCVRGRDLRGWPADTDGYRRLLIGGERGLRHVGRSAGRGDRSRSARQEPARSPTREPGYRVCRRRGPPRWQGARSARRRERAAARVSAAGRAATYRRWGRLLALGRFGGFDGTRMTRSGGSIGAQSA